jgi:hypothetical protein
MTSITIWGPIFWSFFHILAESIRDEYYLEIHHSLISFIKRICSLLPCPICSMHASDYLQKINFKTMDTKYKFKLFIFHFHNHVNEHKKKTLFLEEDLIRYENQNLVYAFQHFIHLFQSKRNLGQINQSFYRSRLIKELIGFFQQNAFKFQK